MTAKRLSQVTALGSMLACLLIVGAGCPGKADVTVDANANVNVQDEARGNVNKGEPKQKESKMLTVELKEQNGSKIMGKALLVEQNDKTKVMINVDGTETGTPNPAHIHLGSCPNPGAVKWPLSDVMEGKSVTVIDAAFDDIIATGQLAINLHKSATEISSYVACGDLIAANVKPLEPGAESMMSSNPEVKANVGAKANVVLKSVSKLGATGTATVSEMDGKTMVSVRMNGNLTGTLTAHVHAGKCPLPGAIKYELNDAVDGKSDTTLNAKIADVMAAGQLSIDVHQSVAGIVTSIACGDLPLWDAVNLKFKL